MSETNETSDSGSSNGESEAYGLDYISLADYGVKNEEEEAWDLGGETPEPADNYLFEVVQVAKKPASTGTPQFIFTSKVVEGGPDGSAGRRIREWFPLTEKARGKILGFLKVIGMKLDDRKGFSPKAVVGMKFRAAVVTRDIVKTNPVTQEVTSRPGVSLSRHRAA